MKDHQEYFIFLNELGYLFSEYTRCNNEDVKRDIIEQIKLLGEVIDLPIYNVEV